MKRFFTTPAIWAVAAVFSIPTQLFANSEQIEEQVISASPHGKTEAEIAGSVNVIDGDALQREVAATLGATLQNQIGVHSSSFGPGVGVPVIRGQSGKRVEILQNGSTVGDVSDTSPDHAVATEALLADRIEILRGPSTLRYGAGAIGGVVNVIDNRIHTQKHEGIDGALETRFDSNSDASVFVGRIDAGSGNFGFHLDAVTRDSDNVDIPGLADHEADDPDETTNGYIANSDSEADSWNMGFSWVGDSIIAGFSIGQIENNYGIPPGAHGHHEEGHAEEEGEEEHAEEEHSEEEEEFVRIDMEQTQYQGKLLFSDLGNTWDRLNIDLSYTDYSHQEIEIADGISEIGTLFDVQSSEINAELTHKERNGWLGTLGVELNTRDFSAVGEEAFVPASGTDNIGLYIIEETNIGSATLEFGARYDDQTISSNVINDINHDSFNLSASYLLPINDKQRLGFILSRSERSPVSEELLSDGEHIAEDIYVIGDASLGAETSFNAELTWAYEAEAFSAKTSLFHSDFSDYIYRMDTERRFSHDREDDGKTGINACSDNIADFENNQEEFDESVECFLYTQEDATFTGAETEAVFAIGNQQKLRVWGDVVRAEFAQSGDVPRMPPARLGASWQFDAEHWTAQLSLTHALDQNRPGDNQEATEGYTRLDAYISYTAENLSLFAKGSNLTDEDIRNSTSFLRELAPEAGIGITVGARYRF